MRRRDLIAGIGAAALVPALPMLAEATPAFDRPIGLSKHDRLVRYDMIDKLDVGETARWLDETVARGNFPKWLAGRGMMKYGDWFYYNHPDGDQYDIHPKLVMAAIVDEIAHQVLGWVIAGTCFLPKRPVAIERPVSSIEWIRVSSKAAIFPAEDILHLTQSYDAVTERWPFGFSVFENPEELVSRTGFEPVLAG